MPELSLDYPKRMFHFGADTGFDLPNPISQGVDGHGRVGMTKELPQQMNAKHHLSGKRRAPRLARRCMRRNQGQPRSRNHQVHLVQKFTLARALGDKFESCGGKADLFHLNLTHETLNRVTFADIS